MGVAGTVASAPRAVRVSAAVAIGVIAFLIATLGSCGSGSSGHTTIIDDAGRRETINGRAASAALTMPALTLLTPGGSPYPLRARTSGKLTLVYFGYTSCPDVCPATMADISAALADVGFSVRSRVNVVFITTDPTRDTGDALFAWIDRIDRSFIALRGTTARVRAAARELGVDPGVPEMSSSGQFTVAHGTTVTAFAADGRALAVYPAGTTIPEWSHDLPILVRGGATI
jgi:protein SCO1/2